MRAILCGPWLTVGLFGPWLVWFSMFHGWPRSLSSVVGLGLCCPWLAKKVSVVCSWSGSLWSAVGQGLCPWLIWLSVPWLVCFFFFFWSAVGQGLSGPQFFFFCYLRSVSDMVVFGLWLSAMS